MITRRFAFAALALLVTTPSGFAQSGYPSQIVRIVVPFGAGSATDMLARVISDELSRTWGERVIVENRPGVAGTTAVAKSPADGYTLMLTSNGHTVAGLINKGIQFDPVKDFAGVTTVASIPLLVVASKEFPANNLKEFVDLAKAKPGVYSFASPGLGSTGFLANALFNYNAGINMIHVPYKSSPECVTATLRNDTQVYFIPAVIANELVKTDRLRAYAVTTSKRISLFPDVPTLQEAGVPSYLYDSWFGIMAPTGTPQAIIDKVNKDVGDILKRPDIRDRLARDGVEAASSTPKELDALIKSDADRFSDLFAKAGIGDGGPNR